MLEVNSKIQISIKEFQFSFARSPGPGGQNVNKLNTKVILRWDLDATRSLPEKVKQRFRAKYSRRITKTGEVIITSTRFRDQGRNVADAMHKLKELILTVAEDPKPRKKKRRSKSSQRKRLDQKKRNSDKKRGRQGGWD